MCLRGIPGVSRHSRYTGFVQAHSVYRFCPGTPCIQVVSRHTLVSQNVVFFYLRCKFVLISKIQFSNKKCYILFICLTELKFIMS